MNNTVYKYHLPRFDAIRNEMYEVEFQIPLGAEILNVQIQKGEPYLWALVNPEETAVEHRKFFVVGTGHGKVRPGMSYVTTIQDRYFVWHIFSLGDIGL